MREPPPTELARELAQVRERARALADNLRSTNAPFPEDFPKEDISAIAAQMFELVDGTAQGCLPPLEYADMRLSDIRSLHFPATTSSQTLGGDHAPTLARDEGLDRDLSGLIVSVATARRVANRIAAIEFEEKGPEPSVSRIGVAGLADLESKGARLEEDHEQLEASSRAAPQHFPPPMTGWPGSTPRAAASSPMWATSCARP